MPDSLHSICRDLENDSPSLTMVNLSGSGLGDNGGAMLLAKALRQNTRAVVLFLNQNELRGMSQAWFQLSLAIAKHPNLEYLYLSHNPDLGNYGVTLLAKVLSQHQGPQRGKLRVLKLAYCNISRLGAHALSWWVADTTTLKTLDLQHNQIDEVGAKTLARALKNKRVNNIVKLEECSSLELLDLQFNPFCNETICHCHLGYAQDGVSASSNCWWHDVAQALEQGNSTLCQILADRDENSSKRLNSNDHGRTVVSPCFVRAQLFTLLNKWGRKSFGNSGISPSVWVKLLGKAATYTSRHHRADQRQQHSLLYQLLRARPDLVVPSFA